MIMVSAIIHSSHAKQPTKIKMYHIHRIFFYKNILSIYKELSPDLPLVFSTYTYIRFIKTAKMRCDLDVMFRKIMDFRCKVARFVMIEPLRKIHRSIIKTTQTFYDGISGLIR